MASSNQRIRPSAPGSTSSEARERADQVRTASSPWPLSELFLLARELAAQPRLEPEREQRVGLAHRGEGVQAAVLGVAGEPPEVDARGDVGGAGRGEEVLHDPMLAVAVRLPGARLVAVVDQQGVATRERRRRARR